MKFSTQLRRYNDKTHDLQAEHLWKQNYISNQTFTIINKPKKVRLLSKEVRISASHTSFMNEEAIICNGLAFRKIGENQQLIKSLKEDYQSREINKIKTGKRIIPIGGNSNYGHFVFEFIPKMVYAAKYINEENLYLFTESTRRWSDLARIVHKGITGKEINMAFIPDKSTYYAKDVALVESSYAQGLKYYSCFETWLTLSKVITHLFGDNKANKKLYLRRPNNKDTWRKIINAEEIREIAIKNNYQVIEMGKLSQEEQLVLLANCDNVIVEAGADSLAPSLCRTGANVIELIPKSMVAGFGSVSSHLALRQSYKRVIGQEGKTNRGHLEIDKDYLIDKVEFQKTISKEG